MNAKQCLSMAFKSLKGNKIRAFLTMLGIIIGVASVIVLVSLVDGMAKDMVSQFENMGTNLVSVNIQGRGATRTVDVEDFQELVQENQDIIAYFSPVVSASVSAKYQGENLSASVTGVSEDYEYLTEINLSQGRFLSYIDVERSQKVCVIGSYYEKELFAGASALDQTLRLNGEPYRVIGVLEETADSEEGSADAVIYTPYTSAAKLSFNGVISSYQLGAVDTDSVEAAMALADDFLYGVFEDEDLYSITSQEEMIETVDEMLATVSSVLVGIAGISLLVGGIGIMNIMLVSVIERTKEIGIRKSLGAKRKDIMRQFVIEASVTSAMGGIVGILLGIVMAYGAGSLLDMTVAPTLSAISLAFGVSVFIGILFGYFPASKAAKLNPIDALRYD